MQLNTTAYVLTQLAGKLPSRPIQKQFLRDLPELSDTRFYERAQIDILIGADLPDQTSVALSAFKKPFSDGS